MEVSLSQTSIRLAFDEVGLLHRLPSARSITLDCPDLKPPNDLSDEGRRLALQAWGDRTRSEYSGVMIVRHFHGLLVDLNSPMDLQELALAMVLQEQQHARLCMEAVKSLGGSPELTFELDHAEPWLAMEQQRVALGDRPRAEPAESELAKVVTRCPPVLEL